MVTQLRSNRQLMDNTVSFPKMVQADFLQGTTWTMSSDNTAVLDGLATPTGANQAVIKSYVDGLIDTSMKSPDGYATVAAGDYPTDYKGTGTVAEGDTFYITSVAGGTTVGTQTVNVGDMLVALQDTPGNTDSNWAIIESNRDYATDATAGVIEIATQAEADTGTDYTRAITPSTLAGYVTNAGINKVAGAGMTEDASNNFNVIAADLSLTVNADDMAVNIGNTNGTSLEVSATGLELTQTVTGARTFTGGAFTVDSGAGVVNITSGGTLTLDATADNAVLTAQPTGGTALAVATTQYVDNAVGAVTNVYNELPTVTDGSANVTLSNTPTAGTERVYLNGNRQAPGASNDYTISGTTITFSSALQTGDVCLVDYSY